VAGDLTVTLRVSRGSRIAGHDRATIETLGLSRTETRDPSYCSAGKSDTQIDPRHTDRPVLWPDRKEILDAPRQIQSVIAAWDG
jgi:hypothetical protein